MVNVIDCGTPINPRIVETQISGASIMQLGFTMFEKMHLDGGQVTNASLADYKIPGIADVPRVMINETVRNYQQNGPFSAKGAAESATLSLSPAIPVMLTPSQESRPVVHWRPSLPNALMLVKPVKSSRPCRASARRSNDSNGATASR